MNSKRIFQSFFAVLSLIPISMGLLNIVKGVNQHIPQEYITASLDSYHRFASSWFFGLGIIVLWMLPKIEKHGGLFALVSWLMFLGGISRVISYVQYDMPVLPMFAAGILELIFPVFILWQKRIASTK